MTTNPISGLTAPVGTIGGMWMLHPEVLGPCREFGYPNGYAYYVAGRGGVLGDVEADVVSAAFGFFAPSLVAKMWTAGIAAEGARAAARRYGTACAEFGQSRLADFDGADRLAALADRVASDVDAAGLSLFAGWRAEPRPTDAGALAFFCIHLLRELRGSAHLVAVLASGLSPRDAVLASGGTAHAELFGWRGPFPDVDPGRRAAAEELTDQYVERLYRSVLADDEIAELVHLVGRLETHLAEPTPD
ncbi:MAG: SCO6745 family protein [Ilumatobacteraceae bacterium]